MSSLEGGEERSCKLESDVLLGAVGGQFAGRVLRSLIYPGKRPREESALVTS